MSGYFLSPSSVVSAPSWWATIMAKTAVDGSEPCSVLYSVGVVLMSFKVNFHVYIFSAISFAQLNVYYGRQTNLHQRGLKGTLSGPWPPLPGAHPPLPAGAPDLGPPYALYLWGILCSYLSIFDSWAPGWCALGNNQRTFLALSLLMIYFTNAPTQLSCTTLGMRRRLRSSVYVQKRVNFSQKKNSCQEKVPPWYKRETLPSVLVALPGDLLYGEAPPERGLQVYVRQGFSSLEVYKRVGKSVILVCKRIRRV